MTVAAIGIEMNPLLVQELRHSRRIGALLRMLCEAVETECIADPRSDSESGVYRDSFGTDVAETPRGWVGTVYNTDPAAAWVEFGAHAGGVTPVLGYHIMTRALDRVAGTGVFEHLADSTDTSGA